MFLQECGLILRSQASERDATKGVWRLYHARLLAETLHMAHTWYLVQAPKHKAVYHYGIRLALGQALVVLHLDMTPKAQYLLLYLALEAQHQADADYHDGYTDGHAQGGYLYGWPGDFLGIAGIGGEAAGNEPGEHTGKEMNGVKSGGLFSTDVL